MSNIIKILFFITILIALSCNNEKGGTVIETIAGNGASVVWYEDGMEAKRVSVSPEGIYIDKDDNLYISLLYDIGRINLKEGLIYRFAGDGIWSTLAPGIGDGGNAVLAKIAPNDITQDSEGNFYIADLGTYRIRKIDTNGIITTLVGGGTGFCPITGKDNLDGCYSDDVLYVHPVAISINKKGEIHWADISTFWYLYKLESSNRIVKVAGSYGYRPDDDGDGGPAREAYLPYINSISFDNFDNLYIATLYRVRKVNSDGIITTIAGDGSDEYKGEYIPATSQGMMPVGILPDNEGGIYILDSANYRLYYVDGEGIIHTVAGNGIPGPYGDGGDPLKASIAPCRWGLAGMAFDSKGNLYFSDTCNAKVRRIVFNQ